MKYNYMIIYIYTHHIATSKEFCMFSIVVPRHPCHFPRAYAVVGNLLDQWQHDLHTAIREGTEEFNGNAIA